MPLTAQAAVAQRGLTDAEWIRERGPQTFRPTNTGMVHGDGQLYMLVADYRKVVAHYDAIVVSAANAHDVLTSVLERIANDATLTALGMATLARDALAKVGAA